MCMKPGKEKIKINIKLYRSIWKNVCNNQRFTYSFIVLKESKRHYIICQGSDVRPGIDINR